MQTISVGSRVKVTHTCYMAHRRGQFGTVIEVDDNEFRVRMDDCNEKLLRPFSIWFRKKDLEVVEW